jgi:3'(2'), 5'-bisphosphate nucleotidase
MPNSIQKGLLVSITVLALAIILPSILPRLSLLTKHLVHPRKMSTTTPYAHELRIARLAVQRAATLTRAVYISSAKGTQEKADHSPVTIGDFGAQALIIKALRSAFPADAIVAEEEADDLRADAALRDAVWKYVADTRSESDEELGGRVADAGEMMDLIDGGGAQGGRVGRVWTLDPIDGTKGFLRGGQYAIALALLVDGRVQVGVLGCPNLPVDDTVRLNAQIGHDQSGVGNDVGVIVSAVRGQGARSVSIAEAAVSDGREIRMRHVANLKEASFCESVEAAHSNQSQQGRIAATLGITHEPVRMDSQAKYASIARGAGDIYLRLPAKAGYQEKIWDHAGGDLIVCEAGGKCTDVDGKERDFGLGRTLGENKGLVCAATSIHDQVLEAVRKVLKEDGKL